MFQVLLTYFIIGLAVAYVGYCTYVSFKKPKAGNACEGCASCPAKKEILHLIDKKKNHSI